MCNTIFSAHEQPCHCLSIKTNRCNLIKTRITQTMAKTFAKHRRPVISRHHPELCLKWKHFLRESHNQQPHWSLLHHLCWCPLPVFLQLKHANNSWIHGSLKEPTGSASQMQFYNRLKKISVGCWQDGRSQSWNGRRPARQAEVAFKVLWIFLNRGVCTSIRLQQNQELNILLSFW